MIDGVEVWKKDGVWKVSNQQSWYCTIFNYMEKKVYWEYTGTLPLVPGGLSMILKNRVSWRRDVKE
jgi:hypothetical protein